MKGSSHSGTSDDVGAARLSLASTAREGEIVFEVLDLDRMTLISSVGLTVIADAAGRIGRRGGTVSLHTPNHALSKLLKLIELGALVATPPAPDFVDRRRLVSTPTPWD